MQESKTYQRQMERAARETTIENTLALLADQFQPETVSALTPAIRNVNDSQKLKQVFISAARAPNLLNFRTAHPALQNTDKVEKPLPAQQEE